MFDTPRIEGYFNKYYSPFRPTAMVPLRVPPGTYYVDLISLY